ncbi:MAG: hypothetical protein RR495_01210 [Anaerovoracaceae bacterium]
MSTKKIIIIALIVIIAISPFVISSWQNDSEETENTLKTDIFDYYEKLRVKYDSANSEAELKEVIKSFSESLGFKVNDLGNGNLKFSIKPSEGYSKAKSTTLQIGYSTEYKKDSSQVAAIALATLKNSTNHGKINVLITPENKKATTSVSKISKEDLQTDNFINLTKWSKNAIFNGSSMTKDYKITKGLHRNIPNGNKAYEIKIDNMIKSDSGDRTEKHTNPIVFIGDILASAKASGTVMEIASFEGGNKVTDYPTSAKAVVVIDGSSEKKFTNKLAASKTSFRDKNRNRDADATFEYKEVPVPSQVLSLNDTSRLLSLLYTLVDGIYATTEEDYEGDVLALSTISSIKTGDFAELHAIGRSVDNAITKDMDNTFKTTSNLSDFTSSSQNRYPLWKADVTGENNDVQSEFTIQVQDAFEKHNIKPTPRYNFVESDCAVFKEINPSLEIISIGVNIENAYDQASGLVTLFENMKPTEK